MIIGRKDQTVKDDFTVLDPGGDPVTGLSPGSFGKKLYNPVGIEVTGSLTVTIVELDSGNYRVSFVPDSTGLWYLVITHPTYFPSGKGGSFQVFDDDFDTLGLDLEFVRHIEGGRWRIIGNQMIFYEDDNTTEVARFNLFDQSGSPSMVNVFERQRVP